MSDQNDQTVAAREMAMRDHVRAAVLRGTRWYDYVEMLALGPRHGPPQDPVAWKRAGQIFALTLKGRDHFPAYGVDQHTGWPRPALQDVLAILSASHDAWGMAVWFDVVNRCSCIPSRSCSVTHRVTHHFSLSKARQSTLRHGIIRR